eukprot:CAMPEP_0198139570 /NCGR_PEP_ID=MMETSP1443-20131203/2858_1 /TAXON_ID=186043 /ORGANISM="Entomoneis sp., Strain CCMP2396" /LENGTH=53 /DNA_ID=CAMNT_0043801737 /DNA_START=177 /DNA_END=338 /DNA_ORIENTATION=-
MVMLENTYDPDSIAKTIVALSLKIETRAAAVPNQRSISAASGVLGAKSYTHSA